MKKSSILLLLAAATVLVSCGKDNLGADAVENGGSTVSAVIEDENSKTTLDGVQVLWASDDAIAINKTQYKATPDAADPRKAIFTLVSNPFKPATAPTDAPFCAYYPFSANNTTSKGQFKLPSTQNYGLDDKIANVSPMYAVVNDLSETFHFKNVCGLLTIDLKGEGTVSNITISANEYLAGILTDIAISDKGELTYSPIEYDEYYASKSVSLGCGKLATLSKETARRFYIALPEGDFTGVKMTVTTNLGTFEFPATKTVSIKKNNIYHLPEMTVATPDVEFNATVTIVSNETVSSSESKVKFSIAPADKNQTYAVILDTKANTDKYTTDEQKKQLARSILDTYTELYSIEDLLKMHFLNIGDITLGTTCSPDSEYSVISFGLDENLNVSKAMFTNFKTPVYERPAYDAEYEDYLGTWQSGDQLLEIAKDVEGESYIITGLVASSTPLPAIKAIFDNGVFVLSEQAIGRGLSPVYPEDGEGTFYLSGGFLEEGYIYPSYPAYSDKPGIILEGKYADGNIIVEHGICDYGELDFLCLYFLADQYKERPYWGDFLGRLSLGNLTPFTGLPDALFGQWVCASAKDEISQKTYTNWTWTISQTTGASIAIENYDIALAELAPLKYVGELLPAAAAYIGNDKNGQIVVSDGTSTGLTTSAGVNINFEGSYDTNYDAVFDVDLEAGTITLVSEYFDSEDVATWSSHTQYNKPIVFTKVAPVSSSSAKTVKVSTATRFPKNSYNYMINPKGKELKPAESKFMKLEIAR